MAEFSVELKPLTQRQEIAVTRYLESITVENMLVHTDGTISSRERDFRIWSPQTMGLDPTDQSIRVSPQEEGLLIMDLYSRSVNRILPKDIRLVDPTPRTGVLRVGEFGTLLRFPRISAYDAPLGNRDSSIRVPEEYRGRQLLVKWFLASPNIRARRIDAAVIDPESSTLVERIIERK